MQPVALGQGLAVFSELAAPAEAYEFPGFPRGRGGAGVPAGLKAPAQTRDPPRAVGCEPCGPYSHSIVAGGFPEMSYTTREIPGTSLTMRRETTSRNSYGSRAQCAVMKSTVSTARSAIT